MMQWKINWDALGITASLACAIHCALLPLLFTALPVFGVELLHNDVFEYLMIGLAFVVGVRALQHGQRKHHHSGWPTVLFAAGMGLLVAKQIWHPWQLYFLVPAVALIVGAHYFNYRLCQRAKHCHADDCRH
jgi:hypothetical protein